MKLTDFENPILVTVFKKLFFLRILIFSLSFKKKYASSFSYKF